MVAIALTGVDGAGKTTIANRLRTQFPVPVKYIYMGTSVRSANYALPTSRLILYLKRRRHQKRRGATADTAPVFDERSNVRRGKLGATLSLLNQLAEEWYRQLISWSFQVRGQLVLYDRHFLFEHAIPRAEWAAERPRLTERIHLWMLNHAYPKPHLTLFLDLPVEVAQQRKKEQTVARLRRHREAALETGRSMDSFVAIDARQSVDEVYAQVTEAIGRVYSLPTTP